MQVERRSLGALLPSALVCCVLGTDSMGKAWTAHPTSCGPGPSLAQSNISFPRPVTHVPSFPCPVTPLSHVHVALARCKEYSAALETRFTAPPLPRHARRFGRDSACSEQSLRGTIRAALTPFPLAPILRSLLPVPGPDLKVRWPTPTMHAPRLPPSAHRPQPGAAPGAQPPEVTGRVPRQRCTGRLLRLGDS